MNRSRRPSRMNWSFERRGLRACIGGVAALALGLLGSARDGAAAPEGGVSTQSIEVVEIEVPVQVLVDGRPLRGLTREDFILTADGKKQEILGFAEVDVRAPSRESGGASPSEIPLSARRHFLVFFDLSNASPAKVVRARDAALALVRSKLEPSDMVSVATFSQVRGVRVVLGFTPDHRQVEQAITTLGLSQLIEPVADPLGLVFSTPGSDRATSGGFAGASQASRGRPTETLDEAFGRALLEEQNQASLRDAHQRLAVALTELAETLRPVAGRKHVLYLSEGVGSSLLLGIGRGATANERRDIEQMNEASMRGDVTGVSSELRFGETSALVTFETMLKEFARAGATIQAIDIGGLRADDGPSAGENTLFMMADKTGGEFIRNYNDLEAAMGRVLSRTAVSYLLSFEASGVEKGDQYKRIK